MKKIFFFLSLLLCTVRVAAQDEVYAVLEDGFLLKFYYDDRRSDREGMLNWHTQAVNDAVEEVEFDKSFAQVRPTSLKDWFRGLNNLTHIDFDNLNTEDVQDMSGLFYGCGKLGSLDLSSFNTSKVTNMSGMFEGCNSLSTLNVSTFDTEQVTNMQGMFSGCSSLATLDLSSFNTRNVLSMSELFYKCRKLASLDISSFDFRRTKSFQNMFSGCTKLSSITFPESVRTQNVTDMSYMFADCQSLVSLDLSQFNLNHVTNMDHMFYQCYELVTLKLPETEAPVLKCTNCMLGRCHKLKSLHFNIGTSAVTDMRNMFFELGVTSLTFGENFSTASVTDMHGMFSKMYNLTKPLDFSRFDTRNVENMSYMFNECKSPSLTFGENFRTDKVTDMENMFAYTAVSSLDLSPFNTENVESMHSMFSNSALTSITFGPGFNTSNVTEMQDMFHGCKELTSLDLSSFDTHRVTQLDDFLDGCEKLTSVTFGSQFNTENVTRMDGMFYDCEKLSSIDLSRFDTRNVYNMSYMFAGCSSLVSLDLSGFDTRKVTNFGMMFQDCSSLTTLDLSSFDTQSAIDLEGMFITCVKLEDITFGPKFTCANAETMKNMFRECQKLISLDLSMFNTSKVLNMSLMFGMCETLSTLDLSMFDTRKVQDMFAMFQNCISLTSVDLSSFNTSRVSSFDYMFSKCLKLSELDLTNFDISNAETMSNMFDGCAGLKTIYCNDSWVYTSADASNLFDNCISLTGGKGSPYSEVTVDYARPDGGVSAPGYFTTKKNELYTLFDPDNNTLTVYYDTHRESREKKKAGIISDLLPEDKRVNYDSYKDQVEKAVIHPSVHNTYLSSTSSWFTDMANLKSVEGLENLKTDGMSNMSYMFNGCKSLESIDLSQVNTADVTNMSGLFYGCESLKEVNLKGLLTSKVTDMRYMFQGCKQLEDIDLTMFDTYSLTDASFMFYECESLSSLDLSTFNISTGVHTSMMLSMCSKLETIYCNSDLSGTSANTYQMFYGSEKLKDYSSYHTDGEYARPDSEGTPGYFTAKKMFYTVYDGEETVTFYYDTEMANRVGFVNLPGMWSHISYSSMSKIHHVVVDASVNTALPSSTERWFAGLHGLNEITGMENIHMDEVTDMSGMFEDCSGLTSLDLSGWNTGKAENMSSLFSGCTYLNHLTLGEDFNTSSVRDMSYMFFGCAMLSRLDLDFNTPNLTDMNHMFAECQNMDSIVLGDKFSTAKVTDMNSLFSGCVRLRGIRLPDTFSTENVTDMSFMFANCMEIEELDVRYFDVRKVTNMRSMFAYCKLIKELDLRGFIPWSIEDVRDMFRGCESLVTIKGDADEWWYSLFSENMFLGCTSIIGWGKYNYSEYYVDKDGLQLYFTNEAVMYVAFVESEEILYVQYDKYMPDIIWYNPEANISLVGRKKHFEDYRLKVKKVVFYFEEELEEPLESVEGLLSQTVNGERLALENLEEVEGLEQLYATDYSGLFKGCKSLKEVKLDEKKMLEATRLSGMFEGCESLTEIDLSPLYNANKVTDLSRMFKGCTSLSELDLRFFDRTNVTNTSEMFAGCSSLTTLTDEKSWLDNPMLEHSENMFLGCTSLVGGNGTTYSDTHTGGEYARVDSKDEPGYFSAPEPEAYLLWNVADSIVTFCYNTDRNKLLSSGEYDEKELPLIENWNEVASLFDHKTINRAVFKSEFASARPNSTIEWFSGAENMTVVKGLEYLNTSEVTDMSGMFYGCKKLEDIDLSTFNTSNVLSVNSMFYDCNAVEELDLSAWDWSKVTDMRSMFRYCYELKSIDFGKEPNTDNLLSMSNMFQGCKAMETVDLSRFNTNGVMDMDALFRGCSALKTLDLSNFTMEHTAGASEMFYACSALTTIHCSNDWSLQEGLLNSENMFYGCTSLVGGNGTAYDKDVVDKSYARPDGGKAQHGYFTGQSFYTVTLIAENGKIEVAESETDLSHVAGGTTLHLTATPEYGYQFAEWKNYDPEAGLVVNSDTTVTALFAPKQYTLTVNVEPAAGGTYMVEGLSKSNTGAYMTEFTIEAVPAEGYEFVGWMDGDMLLDNQTDKMKGLLYGDMTITILFQKKAEENMFTLNVYVSPIGAGEVMGAGSYKEGETATLVALPKEGYKFSKWSDESTDNPYPIVMDKNYTFIAYFEKTGATGVEDVQRDNVQCTKVLRDGVLYLMYNGTMYDVQGRKVGN